MSARILVDTNVLVYAYDRAEPVKQRRAVELLDQLVPSGAGAVTTQVLAEFFVTVTRKLAAPLSVADAYVRVEHFLQALTVYDLTGLVVLEAARGARDH